MKLLMEFRLENLTFFLFADMSCGIKMLSIQRLLQNEILSLHVRPLRVTGPTSGCGWRLPLHTGL